jgi:hypothetical protein
VPTWRTLREPAPTGRRGCPRPAAPAQQAILDIPLPNFPPHRSIYELRPTRGQKPSHIDPREADSRDVVLRYVYRADRQRCSLNLPLDQHGEHFAGAAQIEGIIPTAGLDRTNTCTPHVAGGLRMGRRRGSSRLCHRRDCGSHVGSPRMSRARYSWNRRRCRQALTVWSERTALTS